MSYIYSLWKSKFYRQALFLFFPILVSQSLLFSCFQLVKRKKFKNLYIGLGLASVTAFAFPFPLREIEQAREQVGERRGAHGHKWGESEPTPPLPYFSQSLAVSFPPCASLFLKNACCAGHLTMHILRRLKIAEQPGLSVSNKKGSSFSYCCGLPSLR